MIERHPKDTRPFCGVSNCGARADIYETVASRRMYYCASCFNRATALLDKMIKLKQDQ